MRQPTLRACLEQRDAQIPRAADGSLEVWDLFAGGGGFSTGAELAGCTVAYACDAWQEAVEIYRENHPGTRAECLELPARIPFPTDGRPFHVHGSPPCQRFTDMGRAHNTCTSVAKAGTLVEWFLETALTCGATSWSMEQVSKRDTITIVERMRKRYPSRVAYATIDFYELGVPQRRKRLIAGSPELIGRLVRMCGMERRRSIRNSIPRPRGTMVRNNKGWTHQRLRHARKPGESKYVYSKVTDADCGLFPLTGPAPTVTTCGDVRWWWRTADGTPRSVKMSVLDNALLQTFPSNYKWPSDVEFARQLIGNAVPPLVAQLMLGR